MTLFPILAVRPQRWTKDSALEGGSNWMTQLTSGMSTPLNHIQIHHWLHKHCLEKVQYTARHNIENLKQIFPEKELRGHDSQFPHSCVCEPIYIFPQLVFLFCWRKYLDRSWIIAHRHMNEEIGEAAQYLFLGIHNRDFRCIQYIFIITTILLIFWNTGKLYIINIVGFKVG